MTSPMGVTRISSHIAQNPRTKLSLFCSQRSLPTMVTQANCDMAVDRHRSEALSPTVPLSSPSSVSFQNNFVRNCWGGDGRNSEGDDHYWTLKKFHGNQCQSIIVTGIIRVHPHTNYIQDIIGSIDARSYFSDIVIHKTVTSEMVFNLHWILLCHG
jgi:hypothetical protein